MTPPPMKLYPQTLAASFRQRNSFPAVAKLVAWSHWGPSLPPEWEDLARTEAPIDESRSRSSRKVPYDTESDITLRSSVDGSKFPFFLNHIESVMVTKQFQLLSFFSLCNHHLALVWMLPFPNPSQPSAICILIFYLGMQISETKGAKGTSERSRAKCNNEFPRTLGAIWWLFKNLFNVFLQWW